MASVVEFLSDSLWTLLAGMWVELSFVIFFLLGFLILGGSRLSGLSAVRASKKAETLQAQLRKTFETETAAGDTTAAVKTWRAMKARAPTELDTLKSVVQVFLEEEPAALVKEIQGHVDDHRETLCNSRTAATVLDVVARAGKISLMEELWKVFCDEFRIQPSSQIYEVLLGAYASAGDEKQVARVCSQVHAHRAKVTARGYSLTIKGFLKNSMLDGALKQTLDMHKAAFTVPSFAVTQLVRESCKVGRGMEILNRTRQKVPIPPEAIVFLLEHCLKQNDLAEAQLVEQVARQQADSSTLPAGAYDALIKIYVLHNDLYALGLFEEMQKFNVRISEGLCVGLLARCAEMKFLRFAEEIAKYARGRGEMSISVYSGLMKVYAYAGMYAKACGLYDEIVAAGMEPDAMMYGCLMKFAVECGRTDLSRELFNKAPTLDIQNYMSLIRAAGRDKDVERAFQVLQTLKDSAVVPDVAAYNCVLDVCVCSGQMARGRKLMEEMRAISKIDVVTYNTLLKGYCTHGDLSAAKGVLSEMESLGMPPNDVSFNCLINAAVSRGMWQEAWNTVDMMERSGVQVDQYTVSIMMKALKRAKDSRQVERALKLLDRSGLDVCSDEVLLNTVLETCIRHREHHRLERVINSFGSSALQPSAHTYGPLIKACGTLKCVGKCWDLWHKMVDDRALEPNNIALGCMLDALVCNDHTEEAVTLFKKWQDRVSANTIMYSTLIKGFANSRQPSRAMDFWYEMRESKLPMNTVVYNSLIDSQARAGLMEEVSLLVESMEPDGCKPDVITYSTIVKGYCYRGNLDEAFVVFRNMQQNRMADDSVIYNTLLDGCVRHNRMDLADVLLEDMQKFGVKPSTFTLGILVKMYGRRKQLGKAFETMEEIPRKYGFKPNPQVKTCLICACLNNNDFDSALRVFQELRTSEQGADWKTYSSMISGALRQGRLEQAIIFVEEAYGINANTDGKGLPPGQSLDTESIEQILRALVQRGQMESVGIPLLNRLRAARIPVSTKLLSAVSWSTSKLH